jgi:segregation and condensation protein B
MSPNTEEVGGSPADDCDSAYAGSLSDEIAAGMAQLVGDVECAAPEVRSAHPLGSTAGERGPQLPPESDASVASAEPAARIELADIVEACLFAGSRPVPAERIAELVREVTVEEVVSAVAQLACRYHRQNRPYEIARVEGGYVMRLRREYEVTFGSLRPRTRSVRLSQAALDVLAVVAYLQPVTVPEIDSVRGLDSTGIVRQLRRRNLIATAPTTESDRGPVRLVTTPRFLELFNLTSIDDLPRVQVPPPPKL